MSDPLPSFVDGQPAATSPSVNFNGTKGSTVTYVDGLDNTIEGSFNFV